MPGGLWANPSDPALVLTQRQKKTTHTSGSDARAVMSPFDWAKSAEMRPKRFFVA